MNCKKPQVILVLMIGIVCIFLLSSTVNNAGENETKEFVAFSLKAAENHIRNGEEKQAILRLGYITRIIGLVVDSESKDCILIGERDPSLPEIYLDNFVVMLRSVFLYGDKEPPGVTIDMCQDARIQKVRYFGHIEFTHAGMTCFSADWLMKRIGLSLEPSHVNEVRSYFDLAIDEAKQIGWRRTNVLSRFWYYPIVTRVVSLKNGVLLDQCQIAVLTEVLSASVDGQPVQDLDKFCDKPSELFAQSFSDNFDELARNWQVIHDLRNLADLLAISRGLAKIDIQPDLSYWLNEYHVLPVETPMEVDILRNANTDIGFEVYGGVHLEALSIRLKGGDLTAFTEAIIQARPSGSTQNDVILHLKLN